MSKIFKKINEAIEDGDIDEVVDLVEEALEDEEDPSDIMNKGLIEGMNIVGELFKDGELFVPEVLMSANAMDAGMELIKPHLSQTDVKKAGKVIFCTVAGDLHDIGKNLVASMLEGCGFEVINLGVDVGSEKFIEAVKENKADILCLSALLTTTMNYMKEVIDAVQAEGMRDEVKVMVGGAPVTNAFAQQVGADGYSEDASEAVAVARKLVSA